MYSVQHGAGAQETLSKYPTSLRSIIAPFLSPPSRAPDSPCLFSTPSGQLAHSTLKSPGPSSVQSDLSSSQSCSTASCLVHLTVSLSTPVGDQGSHHLLLSSASLSPKS